MTDPQVPSMVKVARRNGQFLKVVNHAQRQVHDHVAREEQDHSFGEGCCPWAEGRVKKETRQQSQLPKYLGIRPGRVRGLGR